MKVGYVQEVSEISAKKIQNYGEQHPDFNSQDMKKWRKTWKNTYAHKQT